MRKTYRITVRVLSALPDELTFRWGRPLQPGVRVYVPVGKTRQTGLVTACKEVSVQEAAFLRPVLHVLDEAPILRSWQWQFWRELADLYGYGLGEFARIVLPPAFRVRRRVQWHVPEKPGIETLRVLRQRFPRKGGVLATFLMRYASTSFSRKRIAEALEVRKPDHYLRVLEALGLIRKEVREWVPGVRPQVWWLVRRLPSQQEVDPALVRAITWLQTLNTDFFPHRHVPRRLRPLLAQLAEQQKGVVERVPVLEVHWRAEVRSWLTRILGQTPVRQKAQALFARWEAEILPFLRQHCNATTSAVDCLILVPRMDWVPLLVEWLASWGIQALPYSSVLTGVQRLWVWQKVLNAPENKPLVLVGTIHALFLPFRRAPAILLEEADHPHWWQNHPPAIRFAVEDIVAILRRTIGIQTIEYTGGTRSPDKHYVSGLTDSHTVPDILLAYTMEKVQIVPLKKKGEWLTPITLERIREVLHSGGQVWCFAPYRGYARIIRCEDCGALVRCPYCGRPVYYAQWRGLVICAACGWEDALPDSCPDCGGPWLFQIEGVERIAELLQTTFPETSIQVVSGDRYRQWVARIRLYDQLERHSERKQKQGLIVCATPFLLDAVRFVAPDLVVFLRAEHLFADYPVYQSVFLWYGLMTARTYARQLIVQTRHPEWPLYRAVFFDLPYLFWHKEWQERTAWQFPPVVPWTEIEVYARRKARLEEVRQQLVQELSLDSNPARWIVRLMPHPVRRRYRLRLHCVHGVEEALTTQSQQIRAIVDILRRHSSITWRIVRYPARALPKIWLEPSNSPMTNQSNPENTESQGSG